MIIHFSDCYALAKALDSWHKSRPYIYASSSSEAKALVNSAKGIWHLLYEGHCRWSDFASCLEALHVARNSAETELCLAVIDKAINQAEIELADRILAKLRPEEPPSSLEIALSKSVSLAVASKLHAANADPSPVTGVTR